MSSSDAPNASPDRDGAEALLARTPELTDRNGNDLYPPAVCNWITDAAAAIAALQPRPSAQGAPVAYFVQNHQGVFHSFSTSREVAEHDAKRLNQTLVPLYAAPLPAAAERNELIALLLDIRRSRWVPTVYAQRIDAMVGVENIGARKEQE